MPDWLTVGDFEYDLVNKSARYFSSTKHTFIGKLCKLQQGEDMLGWKY